MTANLKKHLAERILANRSRITEWYEERTKITPPPFYCSIDLRDSGFKVVPVDSNLFPAGFNNVCPEDQLKSAPLIHAQLAREMAKIDREIPRRILILPESHTQNLYYIENLYYLRKIIQDAGYEVEIGWYGSLVPEGTRDPVPLVSVTGKQLQALPLVIEGGVVSAGHFIPDVILLNNDFSAGYPAALDAITQPIIPSHRLGWHSRKKSDHFIHYNKLAAEFAELIGVDPWRIQVETEEVAPVNFNEDQGIEQVARAAQRILDHTSAAYAERKIHRKPFVFVKNNSGTYGMGITVVRESEELLHLNRRVKNKMSVGKNRMQIQSVAVQEGVPTATIVNRLAAEPVIYLFGGELMGGFLRTNTEKSEEDNLNSQGMVFQKLCMSDLRRDEEDPLEEIPILELVYGWVAKLSALATGMELRQ